MKGPALQNKRIGVLRMAFRALEVFGSFEKRAPGPLSGTSRIFSGDTNPFVSSIKKTFKALKLGSYFAFP